MFMLCSVFHRVYSESVFEAGAVGAGWEGGGGGCAVLHHNVSAHKQTKINPV